MNCRYEELKRMPKIDLHCHLDGSLRPQTVWELGRELGLAKTDCNLDELCRELVAPADCDSLDTYLRRFELPIAVLQTMEALRRVTYELFVDAAAEGVRYLEVRYAPHFHTQNGLTLAQVLESVLGGLKQATATLPIRGNVILSHLRHHSVEQLTELIEAGRDYLNSGVVAIDLCGGEAAGFAAPFADAIQYARSLGYRVTIHAGETGILQNVLDAVVLLRAERIGHGVAVDGDEKAQALLRERKVTIEACPTSNLQTKAVACATAHPCERFYQAALPLTVNTDNRTVSATTMTQEYLLLAQSFQWKREQFAAMYKQGIEASFADDETKRWLADRWDAEVSRVNEPLS